MEEVINKPEEQFQDVLNDLIDFDKNSEEKSALIEEVCRKASKQLTKPAASLNSSIYSSAASSSSSTSSTSDSSTNSASSSSTSSTLSSPSQSNQSKGDTKEFRIIEIIEGYDNLEIPKMEDLGKTARILEHISSEHTTAPNDIGHPAGTPHSDRISTNLYNHTQRSSASTLASRTESYKLTQFNQQANLMQHNIDNTRTFVSSNPNPLSNQASLSSSWKTISGKRDKRRRKPTEQPVLSQHIPGHKGEQEVDWLVKFIESGRGPANNTNNNSTKKSNNNNNNKNTKPQPKRQSAQPNEPDRENNQRKSNSVCNNPKQEPTQSRPLSQQNKQATLNHQVSSMPQPNQTDHRKVQATSSNNQSQTIKRQSSTQEHSSDCLGERVETHQKLSTSHTKRSAEQKKNKSRQDEAAVTFADHIRVNDEDEVGDRYTFGFFEEPRQAPGNQVKTGKFIPRPNEKPNTNNTKTSQVGHKDKMKHTKTSLNSEQKRYKCNDNIDANSFNYHQILEFISNTWESTAKSHRQIVKNTGA